MQSFLKNILPEFAGALVAAGSSIDDDSTEYDMQGYESIMFITEITDSVATGVATLKVQDSATSGSGHADITGATVSATCSTNDDLNGKYLAVEVVKPKERYVQANRASATANIAYGPIFAFQMRGRKSPIGTPSTQAAAPVVVAGS